tara:strand:- start:42 stop:431 length:390 start_codon:yes stop_codon:yes gene_type:complete
MKYLSFLSIIFIKFNFVISEEIECQGAILRILNKTTNEKIYYTTPLSQTVDLNNSSLIVHRCVKIENKESNYEVALISHKLNVDDENNFFGWIFSSSQYINSPRNSIYDIKLEKCLEEDPIFLRNNDLI